jgi:hypothetical protein
MGIGSFLRDLRKFLEDGGVNRWGKKRNGGSAGAIWEKGGI